MTTYEVNDRVELTIRGEVKRGTVIKREGPRYTVTIDAPVAGWNAGTIAVSAAYLRPVEKRL